MDSNILSSRKTDGFFGYLVLIVCLAVVAIRATYTETINLQASGTYLSIDSDFYSLCFSMVLLLAVAAWLVKNTLSRGFVYRWTGLEIGLVLFIIGASVGLVVAADKRAAITDFVSLVIPILMGCVLVQVMDSYSKILPVLLVLVGLGVASAIQCIGQYFVDTRVMIEQYESDPQSILGPLGIAPGSFNQILFEHRLYTRDINGFLTTGNSVGSFAILSFFAAVALFAERLRSYVRNRDNIYSVIAAGIAVILVLLNFVLTRSKGAGAAVLLSVIIFGLLVWQGDWFAAKRKWVFITCAAVLIVVASIVCWYGTTHNRLPGGNSMLVRWQYWQGAGRMYFDYPVTGIGPGNFSSYYTHYKLPGALEEVKDPHNFVLSVLTQYGPVGLVGFMMVLLVPLYSALKAAGGSGGTPNKQIFLSRSAIVGIVVLLVIVLLAIRPIVKPLVATEQEPAEVVLYVVFSIYVVPVIMFVIGVWLGSGLFDRQYDIGYLTMAASIAAVVGLLAHNLVDFAIFEMGIYTAMWAFIAVMIALMRLRMQVEPAVIQVGRSGRIMIVAVAVLMISLFLKFSFLPVAACTTRLRQAYDAYHRGDFPSACKLLDAAAQADMLNPVPVVVKGRFALAEYSEDQTEVDNKHLLFIAEQAFRGAIYRNGADFKNYKRLAEVYELLGEAEPDRKEVWLDKAYMMWQRAVELYPGSGKLRFYLAQAAEAIGRDDIALAHYQKAVEIENAYRQQFSIMYPGTEIFSRLGQDKYEFAEQKIVELRAKLQTGK